MKNIEERVNPKYRAIIVEDHKEIFLIAISGIKNLFTLDKAQKNCISPFEVLSRFEFEATFENSSVIITELIRFDNLLKFSCRDKILSLIDEIDTNIKSKEHSAKPFYELQAIYKEQNIPYAAYNFANLKNRFKENELIILLEKLKSEKCSKDRSALIKELNSKLYLFNDYPGLKIEFDNLVARYTSNLTSKPQTDYTFNERKSSKLQIAPEKQSRILVAIHEAPEVGQTRLFPFLPNLREVKITKVGKAFHLTESTQSKTISEGARRRLLNQKVCWVYYEAKDKHENSINGTSPKSINELDLCFSKLKQRFVLEGVKPRTTDSFINDYRKGEEICDMRMLNKEYWFSIGINNIWYITYEKSSDFRFYNLKVDGKDCAGYVLAKKDYEDILRQLKELNKNVLKVREHINSIRIP